MAKPKGKGVIEFTWAMLGVTFLLVLLRIFVRTSRKQFGPVPQTRRGGFDLAASDLLAILAWLSFVLYTVEATIFYRAGAFTIPSGEYDIQLVLYYSTTTLKWYYVQNVCYLNAMYFVKFSVILTYSEFMSQERAYVRRGLRVLWGYTGISFVLNVLATSLWCLPISKNWTHDPQKWCTPNNSIGMCWVLIGNHLLTDLIIYLFPLPILLPLLRNSSSLSVRQKLGLSVSFFSGFLCIVFGALTIKLSTYSYHSYNGHQKEVLYALFALEHSWALCVLTLPAVVGTIIRIWDRRARFLSIFHSSADNTAEVASIEERTIERNRASKEDSSGEV